jgi:hypothetical protein
MSLVLTDPTSSLRAREDRPLKPTIFYFTVAVTLSDALLHRGHRQCLFVISRTIRAILNKQC